MTPAKKKTEDSKKKKAAPKKKQGTKKTLRRSSGQAAKKDASMKEVAETVSTDTAKKKDAKKADAPISSIRIRLSAFDHVVLDEATAKIIDTAERSGAVIHGPIPLPTKIKKFTVNRSTFVHKDARDQFEMRIHRRLIDLTETTFKTIESLQNLSLPSGVDIEIKMG
jgi:small subunit ribosomal protein S10|tara:strand:+ start:310 stop:810 length:501 start_codon:yes stop_codon:yes gene_type:complete